MVQHISSIVIVRQFLQHSWRLICCTALVLCMLGFSYGWPTTIVLVIASFLTICYFSQRQFIYFPNVPITSRSFVQIPSALGMPFENVFIQTSDRVKLHAMFVFKPDGGRKRPTVLYLHGNAGNIGHQLICAKGLHMLCGFNILLLEYRGYGKSEGYPSEWGFRKDVQAGLEYLLSRDDISHDQIILFGRSIGGAVALDIAADPRFRSLVAAVMVENTFTSISRVAALYVPWTRFFPSWMFRDKYENISKVSKLQCAALYLSGEVDELVPCSMMTELFLNTSSTLKCIERFPTGTHNTTWRCPKYHEAIARFVHHAIHSSAAQEKAEAPATAAAAAAAATAATVAGTQGMTLLDIWGSEDDTSAFSMSVETAEAAASQPNEQHSGRRVPRKEPVRVSRRSQYPAIDGTSFPTTL